MKIERFEDIKAWQEARVLVKTVYALVDSDRPLGRDYRFREQIQGAAVSIMSNIAEGFASPEQKHSTNSTNSTNPTNSTTSRN